MEEGIILARVRVTTGSGVRLTTTRWTMMIHDDRPVRLRWRGSETGPEEERLVISGQCHLLAPDQSIHLVCDVPFRTLVIAVDAERMRGTAPPIENGAAIIPRVRMALFDPNVAELPALLPSAQEDGPVNRRLFASHAAVLLASLLDRARGNDISPSTIGAGAGNGGGGLGAERRRRVVEHIDAHLDGALRLTDLAAIACLSPAHFSRAFKASFGIAPGRYVVARRIGRAKALLLSGNRRLTDVALDLGFSSHSHFTHAFRKATGVTPSRYRDDRT